MRYMTYVYFDDIQRGRLFWHESIFHKALKDI